MTLDQLDDIQRANVARVVAALMAADGRVSVEEIRALTGLDDIRELVRSELARSRVGRIDVAGARAQLATLPRRTRIEVLVVLAQVAASDRCLALRENETLTAIAAEFGIEARVAARVLERALLDRRAEVV